MTPIITELKKYITDNFDNYARPRTDDLDEENESICIRTEPGDVEEDRDLLGNRYGKSIFAIYCKSKNKNTAINQLWTYVNGLDLQNFGLTDVLEITCSPQTEPHFIQKRENGEYVYTSSFYLDYYSRG